MQDRSPPVERPAAVRRARPQAGRRHGPVPPSATGPAGSAGVLGLQRLAGNRAVGSLVRGPAPIPAPGPARAAGPDRTARPGLQRQQTQQSPRPQLLLPGDTYIATRPDVLLFGPRVLSRTWEPVQPTFAPLAGGTFIVDGIPITYGLTGSANARSWAGLAFGPGTLEEIRIFVTGSEAARQRRIRRMPSLAPVLPLLGGAPGAGAAAAMLLDRPWDRDPEGAFEGDAMLRFVASATAGTSAQARLDASLGVFGGALGAGAFAGLSGSATGTARTRVDTYVNLRYRDGAVSMSLVLDLDAAVELAFRLSAFAGVWVELRVPEIPVVTELTHEVQDWPIIGWITPDLSRWRWRREYRRDWPLFERTYAWDLTQRFAVGTGGTTGALPQAQGFSIDDVLRDAVAQQRQGDLRDDPTGPGDERRNGSTAAVSAARAQALAQISSARRAAEREKRANTRLLAQARRTAATTAPAPSRASAPPPVAIGGGGGGGGPVDQLEARGDKLDQAVRATDALRERTDALAEPATAPDGTARNQARSGYEAVAANADALGDKIDAGQEGFAVPAVVEPATADYERMREAMHRAYDAFDGAFDPTRTEKLYADDQLRRSGTDPDLHEYRAAAHAHQVRALDLWRRVQRLEADLERARDWYERRDHALGAVVFGELEATARDIAAAVPAVVAARPVGDWDHDFVELSDGHLLLKPEYRGKATRSYFYPHDYSAETKRRMLAEIGSFRTVDGVVYWEYRRRRSPRGDNWWILDHATEQPTLDHTRPTVLAHWNTVGRTRTYQPRREFYDFVGEPLVVVPKSENSSSGGREPDSYTPRVTRRFRGAKV